MARLNYHHLYYFWQVARHGHLTDVARQLHLSQSALSAQIRQLEQNMGFALFERSGRRLHLTEDGRRVLDYADEIFTKGEELEGVLRHGWQQGCQKLRIGVLASMSRNVIEAFMAPLLGRSDVHFTLRFLEQGALLDALLSHQLDLVLTDREPQGEGEAVWQSQLLARQPLAVIGPAGRRPLGPFPTGFAERAWILPGRASASRTTFDAFCALHGFEPRVQGEADDMAMLRLLARDSGALCLLPAVVVRDEIREGRLEEYLSLPNAYEHFYAVALRRRFMPAILPELLGRPPEDYLGEAWGVYPSCQ